MVVMIPGNHIFVQMITMKYILTIAILFPLAILNSCISNKNKEIEKEVVSTIEEYQNPEFRYSVTIKSIWKKKVFKGEGFYNVIWNLPPIKSKYSKDLVSVNVGVEASKNWESFEDAFSSSQEELKTSSYYYEWDETSQSAVFQYGDPKRQLKGKSYYIHKNNIVYRLTFSANKDSYDHYISEFEQFCKTFKTIH